MLPPASAARKQHHLRGRLRNICSWSWRCTDNVPGWGSREHPGDGALAPLVLPGDDVPEERGWGHVPRSLPLTELLTPRGDSQHPQQGAHPAPSPGELSTTQGSWGEADGSAGPSRSCCPEKGDVLLTPALTSKNLDVLHHAGAVEGQEPPKGLGIHHSPALGWSQPHAGHQYPRTPAALRPLQPAGGTFILLLAHAW